MKTLLICVLSVILLNIACGKIEPAEMQIQPASLNFGESETELKISIVNIGDERLDWYVYSDSAFYFTQPWLTASPLSGINDGKITVTVDRDSLSHGSHRGELMVKSNGGEKEIEVILYQI